MSSFIQISKVNNNAQRNIFKIERDTETKESHNSSFIYDEPSSDEAILSEVNPTLITLKELMVKQIHTTPHHQEVAPARRTFLSHDRSAQLSAESLAEIWHIGIKRAKATLKATTKMVLDRLYCL